MSACTQTDDGRECLRSENHDGPCRFRGLKRSAQIKRARALLLSRDDKEALQALLFTMRDRALTTIEKESKDVIERLLGRDDQ